MTDWPIFWLTVYSLSWLLLIGWLLGRVDAKLKAKNEEGE